MIDTKKHIRSCAICQTQYKYCNNCSEYDHLEPWHLRWCSSNCKDIDGILCDWGSKMISSEEAAEQLKTCDMSRFDLWPKGYQDAYHQVMEEAGLTKTEEPKVEEPKPKKPNKIQAKSRTEKAKEEK